MTASPRLDPSVRSAPGLGALAVLGVLFLSSCSGGGTAANVQPVLEADVRVRVVYAPDLIAPPGVEVTLSQAGMTKATGRTDSAGQVVLTVLEGVWDVAASDPGMAAGTATVTADASQVVTVDVVLENDFGWRELELAATEVVDGVLDGDLPALTLGFADGATPVPVDSVERVELRSGRASATQNITRAFAVQGGQVVASDLPFLRAFLTRHARDEGAIVLRVEAIDAEGRGVEGQVTFHLGLFEFGGVLRFPFGVPSSNVEVRARLLGTTIDRVTTAPTGSAFSLGKVPPGPWFVRVTHVEGAGVYHAFQTVTVQDDLTDLSVLVRDADLWSLGAGRTAITLESAALGVRQLAAKRWTVPRGTAQLQVSFRAQRLGTAAPSRVDDTWELALLVVPSGHALSGPWGFHAGQQARTFPVWQSDDSTGALTAMVDLRDVAATGPAEVALVAGATNWGDAAQRVRINASVSIPRAGSLPVINVLGGRGTSVPALGRFGPSQDLELLFDGLVPNSIGRVTVDILNGDPGAAGAVLGTALDEALGGRAQLRAGVPVIDIDAGFATAPSPLDVLPPIADTVRYRVAVEAEDALGTAGVFTVESAPRAALFEVPGGLRRFRSLPGPAPGEWLIRSVYEWVQNHRGQFAAWGDFAGDHGTPAGALYPSEANRIAVSLAANESPDGRYGSALRNLSWMRRLAETAAVRDSESRARIRAWILAERAWMTDANADPGVEGLLVGEGPPSSVLPRGWFAELLLSGTLSPSQGAVVDLGIGTWDAVKLRVDRGGGHEGFHEIRLVR